MSAGGRVFIVVLVLAFVATGSYYLFVAEGSELESAQAPAVSEPPATALASKPSVPTTPVPRTVPEEVPIATNTLALRIAVPASNPAGVDLFQLRQRLLGSGPDSAGNGIAGWFEVYDPDSFAGNEQMRQAMAEDPAEYFQGRFGLVVEPYDGILQMMLYTLPSRSVAQSSSRGVDVLSVRPSTDSEGRPALLIVLDEATGRRVEQLTEPNVSRPCAMLVNGKVVMAPQIMSKLSNELILAGNFDETQLALIEKGIKGEGKLAAIQMPQPEPVAVAAEPGSTRGNDALVLTTTTTVADAAEESEPRRSVPVQAPATPVPPRVAVAKTTDYVVKEGDTLTSISEMWFGHTSDWTLIAQANPSMDPNRLSIGQVLKLPPKDVVAAAPEASANEYTVRSGDSLATIARGVYGSDRDWKVLYEANRAVIGDDPSELAVGMRLKIPALKKDAP